MYYHVNLCTFFYFTFFLPEDFLELSCIFYQCFQNLTVNVTLALLCVLYMRQTFLAYCCSNPLRGVPLILGDSCPQNATKKPHLSTLSFIVNMTFVPLLTFGVQSEKSRPILIPSHLISAKVNYLVLNLDICNHTAHFYHIKLSK